MFLDGLRVDVSLLDSGVGVVVVDVGVDGLQRLAELLAGLAQAVRVAGLGRVDLVLRHRQVAVVVPHRVRAQVLRRAVHVGLAGNISHSPADVVRGDLDGLSVLVVLDLAELFLLFLVILEHWVSGVYSQGRKAGKSPRRP